MTVSNPWAKSPLISPFTGTESLLSFELEREIIFLEGLLLSRVFEGSLELGPLPFPVKLFLREFELLFLLLSLGFLLVFSPFSLLFREFRLLYASEPDLLLLLLGLVDLPGFSPFSTFSTAIDVSGGK